MQQFFFDPKKMAIKENNGDKQLQASMNPPTSPVEQFSPFQQDFSSPPPAPLKTRPLLFFPLPQGVARKLEF